MFKEIDKRIIERFKKYNDAEYIESIPKVKEIFEFKEDKIYKAPFASISIDVVNFKKMSEHTDEKVFIIIMDVFMNGVVQIMNKYLKPVRVEIQGDGVYAIYGIEKNDYADLLFKTVKALNGFQKNLQKRITEFFLDELKTDHYTYEPTYFKFGIGVSYSKDNYMSVVGVKDYKDTIFMGHSLNCSSNLSKLSSRDGYMDILFDQGFYNELMDETKKSIDNHLKKQTYHLKSLPYIEEIYGCDLIIKEYSELVES